MHFLLHTNHVINNGMFLLAEKTEMMTGSGGRMMAWRAFYDLLSHEQTYSNGILIEFLI